MYWEGKYLVNDQGALFWHEGFLLRDESLKQFYRDERFAQDVIECYAVLGIQIGAA